MDAWLMNKDRVVAEICGDNVRPVMAALMPLYLQRNGSIDVWVKSRAIDAHRTHSRLLKRALRLKEHDDNTTVLSVYAATITDNYWLKPKEQSMLTHADIKFKENIFADMALTGNMSSLEHLNDASKFSTHHTPELTNIGSYEKCWKLEDGKWYMYKCGSPEGIFSELFICELGKQLGFDMAEYAMVDNTTIKTLDFTDGARVNFEPSSSLVGENVGYQFNYEKLQELSPRLASEYCDILFLDAICYNFDRHTMNYGFLRDADEGTFIKMAPNFDNNLALIALEGGHPTGRADMLVTDYLELLQNNNLQPPNIDPLDLRDLATRIADNIPIDVDKSQAIEIVCSRYQIIQKCFEQFFDCNLEL